ncbi:hypothetical protein D3C71_1811070 [compost metagenome]
MVSHCFWDCSSAASAPALRTGLMPSSSLPLRSASSTWVNTTESRASASPAAAALPPPARISVTRRAIEPTTTTCCRALYTCEAGAPPADIARTTSLSCACSAGTPLTKLLALPARASTAGSLATSWAALLPSGSQVWLS